MIKLKKMMKKWLLSGCLLTLMACGQVPQERIDSLKETIADLRFTHASTVHKSQGSTYDNVLVLTPNILTSPGHSTRRRLLYVAYTRASHHLHVMTQ